MPSTTGPFGLHRLLVTPLEAEMAPAPVLLPLAVVPVLVVRTFPHRAIRHMLATRLRITAMALTSWTICTKTVSPGLPRQALLQPYGANPNGTPKPQAPADGVLLGGVRQVSYPTPPLLAIQPKT